VTRLPERVAEPLKTLIKTITGRGTSGLDVLRRISFALTSPILFNKTYPGALPQAV